MGGFAGVQEYYNRSHGNIYHFHLLLYFYFYFLFQQVTTSKKLKINDGQFTSHFLSHDIFVSSKTKRAARGFIITGRQLNCSLYYYYCHAIIHVTTVINFKMKTLPKANIIYTRPEQNIAQRATRKKSIDPLTLTSHACVCTVPCSRSGLALRARYLAGKSYQPSCKNLFFFLLLYLNCPTSPTPLFFFKYILSFSLSSRVELTKYARNTRSSLIDSCA